MRHTSCARAPQSVPLLPPRVAKTPPLAPLVPPPSSSQRPAPRLRRALPRAVPLPAVTPRAHDDQTPAAVTDQQPPVRHARAPSPREAQPRAPHNPEPYTRCGASLPEKAASRVWSTAGLAACFFSAAIVPSSPTRQRPPPQPRRGPPPRPRSMTAVYPLPHFTAGLPRLYTAADINGKAGYPHHSSDLYRLWSLDLPPRLGRTIAE
jgi:hypothetical protein